jgi:microcystin-dependent protein
MSHPYIGEIRIFAGPYAPAGWSFCEGQLLPISENENLFQLIGTTYGGDGQETFALPDLRGRVPVHLRNGHTNDRGESGGVETVTLTVNQIPAHNHAQLGSTTPAADTLPTDRVLATSTADIYVSGPANVPLQATSITPAGGSQPHENMQPYLCLHFIISLFGLFPSAT